MSEERPDLPIGPLRPDEVERVVAFDPRGWSRDSICEELDRSWAKVWAAREQGEVVAYIVVWAVVDELQVLQLATDPAARRRGHARLLLLHALRYGLEHELTVARLEVRRSNQAAQALYLGVGFEIEGERRGYYDHGAEDALEMAMRIDARLAPLASVGDF